MFHDSTEWTEFNTVLVTYARSRYLENIARSNFNDEAAQSEPAYYCDSAVV